MFRDEVDLNDDYSDGSYGKSVGNIAASVLNDEDILLVVSLVGESLISDADFCGLNYALFPLFLLIDPVENLLTSTRLASCICATCFGSVALIFYSIST